MASNEASIGVLSFGVMIFNDTNDTNVTSDGPDCPHQYTLAHVGAIRAVLGFLYAAVMLTAVSGNSLVIYVVSSNRNMQTVTNLFITNLAFSDLLMNFTSLWLTPVYTYLSRWVWGQGLCHGLPLGQGSSIFISTLTLTAIAIDRFIVILYPFRSRISIQVCITVIVSIWMLSLLLVMPYAIHMQLIWSRGCQVFICTERWAWEELRMVYGTFVLVLQFVIPFLMVGYCYVRIWYFMDHRQSMVSNRNTDSELQRKRRLNKMLVSMVVIFAVCWLPWNLLNVLRDMGLTHLMKQQFSFFYLVSHLIAMTATCWNPILYAWMNENFRREFMAALPCFPNISRIRANSMANSRMVRLRAQSDPPPNNHLIRSTKMSPVLSTETNTLLPSEENGSNGMLILSNGTVTLQLRPNVQETDL